MRFRPKILFVDDERASYLAWGRPLETQYDWSVVYSDSAAEALELIDRAEGTPSAFDAVVVDRQMPDPEENNRLNPKTGDKLLKRIVSGYEHICVVMFTNVAGTEIAQLDVRRGASAFLTKGEKTAKHLFNALRHGIVSKKTDRLYSEILLKCRDARVVEQSICQLNLFLGLLEREGSETSTDFISISSGGSPISRDSYSEMTWETRSFDNYIAENRTIVEEIQGDASALVPVRSNLHQRDGRRTIIGFILLVRSDSEPFSEEELRISEKIASAIGLALDSQFLMESTVDKTEQAIESELIAEFAHRVRSPMTTARLTTEQLLDQAYEGLELEGIRTKLERIQRALNDGANAVHNLEDKYRFSSFSVSQVDLCKLADEVIASYDDETQSLVESRYSRSLPLVEADASELRYALLCIIDNAIEAPSIPNKERRIHISIDSDPTGTRDICLSITDNGPGIPEELSLNPFQRGVSNKSTSGGRTRGLGLWEAKRIIQRHGGSVEASSVSEGGTRISILIPVKREQYELEAQFNA